MTLDEKLAALGMIAGVLGFTMVVYDLGPSISVPPKWRPFLASALLCAGPVLIIAAVVAS